MDVVTVGECCAECYRRFDEPCGEPTVCKRCIRGIHRALVEVREAWLKRDGDKPTTEWTYDSLWSAACWRAAIWDDGVSSAAGYTRFMEAYTDWRDR
jgi:hypothetical protein